MEGIRFALSPVARRIAVAVAVLCAGAGCSAPDGDERARFGVVSGFVIDADNNPVAGARVQVVDQVPGAQIGTQNFFGERGPFVANSRGQFRIDGVQVSPTDRVVLNLEVTHPGFLTGFASNVAPATLQIGGGFLIEGQRTRDILVQDQNVGDVTVVLQRAGTTTTIGQSGGVISAPVPQTGAAATAPPVFITVSIPPGAVSAATPITVTPLTPDGLVAAAAPLPAVIPTAGAPAASSPPVVLSGSDPVEFQMVTPFSALDFRVGTVQVGGDAAPGFVFPAGQEPTVRAPLPFPLPAGTSVPIMQFRSAVVTRGRQANSAWELITEGTVSPDGITVVFQVSRPGIYAAVTQMRWKLTPELNDDERQVMEFPPLTAKPNGYRIPGPKALLSFVGLDDQLHPRQLAHLRSALKAALDGEDVHGTLTVFVPGNSEVRMTPTKWSVTVEFLDAESNVIETRTGTWRFWKRTLFPKTPVSESELPPHLQGHVQGGGVERPG